MYILHRCINARVSFKKIKALTEFLGLYPKIAPTMEISEGEFEHLINCLNVNEFKNSYSIVEEETMIRMKQVRIDAKVEPSYGFLKKVDVKKEPRRYTRNYDDIDEEDQIMRALKSGNGDMFGF